MTFSISPPLDGQLVQPELQALPCFNHCFHKDILYTVLVNPGRPSTEPVVFVEKKMKNTGYHQGLLVCSSTQNAQLEIYCADKM